MSIKGILVEQLYWCLPSYPFEDFFLSVTEEPSGNHSTLLELILLVTLCSLATVACITGFGIVWKKKKARKLGNNL